MGCDMSESTGRSIETSVRIDAPISAVWKALTCAEELVNWFPNEARIVPGAGGSIWMKWTDDMQWETPIEAWEPERRLGLIYCEPNEHVPLRVCVEYTLEGDGGSTVLRLVHSGFSNDAAWDGLYDGTVRGWDAALATLRVYLEEHRGEARSPVFIKQSLGELSAEEGWARLVGERGIAIGGTAGAATPEGTISMRLGGERMGAGVVRWSPPKECVARLDELNGAILRVQVDDIFGRRDAYFTLSLWGEAGRHAPRLEEAARSLLGALF